MRTYDLVAIGRVGVDIYPLQQGVPLEVVATFEKYLGGSTANVCVAAARHGHRVALVSRTGDDPFGRYVRAQLLQLGVDDVFVTTVPGGPPTPVTFCELFAPDRFPLWPYRGTIAPDLLVEPGSLPLEAIRDARVLWITGTGLSQEPSRSAHVAAWEARGRSGHTVLDLDYRAPFWEDRDEAVAQIGRALEHVSIAVGNLDECEVVLGTRDPDAAAAAMLQRGVEIAVIKQGGDGALAVTRDERVRALGFDVEVVNALGAGDAFGGALVHGLLSGWSLARTLHFANVAGAIIASRFTCSTAMPTTEDVERLLADGQVADPSV